jgi:putative transcriptional regulator
VKNNLRVLRVERGWTQEGAARQLGVSRQTIVALEAGKYDPSLPLAFRIAHLHNRRIEDIFVYEEPRQTHTPS